MLLQQLLAVLPLELLDARPCGGIVAVEAERVQPLVGRQHHAALLVGDDARDGALARAGQAAEETQGGHSATPR